MLGWICRTFPTRTLFSVLIVLLPATIYSSTTLELEGSWKGSLGPIELIFHFEEKTETGWTGSVDTPQQYSFGLPATVSVAQDGTLTFSVPATQASCEARYDPESETLQGIWSQRGIEIPLKLNRTTSRIPLSAELAKQAIGLYEGHAIIQLLKLKMSLNLKAVTGGGFRGFIVSPDQSLEEIPISRFDQLGDRRMRLCAPSIFLTMDLILSEDGNELAGMMLQGPGQFPLKLQRTKQITSPLRPQTPQPPFPYREFRNSGPGVLATTLLVPHGDGPFPIAILLSGSGSQARNSTLFGHHPFLVLADHLARKGIASLRYDEPGIGESPPWRELSIGDTQAASVTTADQVEIALNLWETAKEAIHIFDIRDEKGNLTKNLIGMRRGFIGHSEGALVAQLVAANHAPIAGPTVGCQGAGDFAISLASPITRGDKLLIDQNRALSMIAGLEPAEISKALVLNRKLFNAVLNAPATTPAKLESLKPIKRVQVRDETWTDQQILEILSQESTIPESERTSIRNQMSIPWIRWFLRYDPAWGLEKIRIPQLFVFGKKDLQVPWEPNVTLAKELLSRPAKPDAIQWFNTESSFYPPRDVELHTFENLNHLFQNCDSGHVSEYGEIEETMSPEVMNLISDWILLRFGYLGPVEPRYTYSDIHSEFYLHPDYRRYPPPPAAMKW